VSQSGLNQLTYMMSVADLLLLGKHNSSEGSEEDYLPTAMYGCFHTSSLPYTLS